MTATRTPAELFTAAFRAHPAGVTVVTGRLGEAVAGATLTSVTSVSRSPALLSLNLSRGLSTYAVLSGATHLAVHFLDESQHPLATRFATSGIDRFADISVEPGATGAPILGGLDRVLEIRVVDRIPAGDSLLVIGEVCAGQVAPSDEPLLYRSGSFAGLARS